MRTVHAVFCKRSDAWRVHAIIQDGEGFLEVQHRAFKADDEWDAIEFATRVLQAGKINAVHWDQVQKRTEDSYTKNFT